MKKYIILILTIVLIYPCCVSANTIEDKIDQAITKLENMENNYFLNTHPVGSIYYTVSGDENTASKMTTKYGGTWEAYAQGRTIIGDGSNGTISFSTNSSPSGSSNFSLNDANYLPSHSHLYYVASTESGLTAISQYQTPSSMVRTVALSDGSAWSVGSGWGGYGAGYCATMITQTGYGSYGQSHKHSIGLSTTYTSNSGSNTAFSVQNPYIVVFMWKRVA